MENRRTLEWRFGAIAGAVALAVELLPQSAAAHARLLRSKPSEGATLGQAPPAIELWFNELLDDAFNSIVVHPTSEARRDPGAAPGTNLATGPATVDRADRTHLSCTLGTLAPGAYLADWQVLSRDGHSARGRVRFEVNGHD